MVSEMIDYDELVRRTPLWLYANNRDLVVEMPNIITEAEDALMLRMDHDLFRGILTGRTVGAEPFDPAGSDDEIDLSLEDPLVMELRAIRVKRRDQEHNWVPLRRRNIEMLSTLYANNRPGVPRYYSEDAGILQFRVYPYPRTQYDIEITVNLEPVPLTATNTTNVLTEQFPRAIEKAVFWQAALFMKNQQDVGTYEGQMNEAVGEANAQIGRRRRDDTGTRPTDPSNRAGN